MSDLDDKADAIWDHLVGIIATQAIPGGKLDGVQHVGKSIHLWTEKPIAMGVQLLREPESPAGIGQHHVDFQFQIIIGASDVEDDDERANLDAANAIVRPLRTALKALLRENQGLDGLAYRTQIHDGRWVWRIEDGDGVPVWAYYLLDYTVQTTVMIVN